MIELPDNYKFKSYFRSYVNKYFNIGFLLRRLAVPIGILLTVLYSAEFSAEYSDIKIALILIGFSLLWFSGFFIFFVYGNLVNYLNRIEELCVEKDNKISILDSIVNDLSTNDIKVAIERVHRHSKQVIILNERMGLKVGQMLSLRVIVKEVDYLIGLISVKRFSQEGKALCELEFMNIDDELAKTIENPLSESDVVARVIVSIDDLNQLKEVARNDR